MRGSGVRIPSAAPLGDPIPSSAVRPRKKIPTEHGVRSPIMSSVGRWHLTCVTVHLTVQRMYRQGMYRHAIDGSQGTHCEGPRDPLQAVGWRWAVSSGPARRCPVLADGLPVAWQAQDACARGIFVGDAL